MKITKRLGQFTRTSALLIVADHYHCTWYEIRHREISTIHRLTLEKPRYSDREDYGRGAGGRIYETGALFEKRHREAIQEFLKAFKIAHHDRFQDKSYDTLYVLAPADLIAPLQTVLAPAGRKIITIAGNFTKEHLCTLLNRISTLVVAAPMYPTTAEQR